ncbi:MAG TPA: peptidoglycan bridge formation glycyltransferase FemA/FemB family protein, partial [Flexilinea sp.]|nr:peptidoglycan bridge formation glycyltransferase FemA/FemB family protein [Flexilinea sp.]
MNSVTLSTPPDHWNEEIASLPGASILQTSQWAEIKAGGGWTPLFQKWTATDGELRAAALILRKKIFLQYEFWYIPRGP